MRKVNQSVVFRRGNVRDSYNTFLIFEEAYADLLKRLGSTTPTSIADPEKLDEMWVQRKPLYEHLANTADQFWVVERERKMIGFGRSILRGDLRQLTELFVLPGEQSGGVGKELIRLTFPEDGVKFRSILSTTDMRAQGLYLRSGVTPRFLAYYFGKTPEPKKLSIELEAVPIRDFDETIELLGAIDEQVFGFRREVDHLWLSSERQGFIYFYEEEPVGFGYVGHNNGPFAVLNPELYPDVLAHAENLAAEEGRDHFGIEVPVVNRTTVSYLLNNGFKMDTFAAVLMTNAEFGDLSKYIFFSPSFFL
jgi:hypothetical protein